VRLGKGWWVCEEVRKRVEGIWRGRGSAGGPVGRSGKGLWGGREEVEGLLGGQGRGGGSVRRSEKG